MATSTLRVLIVLAALVIGVVVLRQAFPSGTAAVAPQSPGPSPATSPSGTPSPHLSPSRPGVPKAKVKGVILQVLNGTATTGLAAQVTQTLSAVGYTVKAPGNAPPGPRTTLFYQASQKLNAEGLRDRFFPGALVKPAPPAAPPDIDIEVVLGNDFVDTGKHVSPSP